MGYLFLSFALLAGITKGYCGKRLGNVTETMIDAVSANLFRMFLCIVIGFGLILIKGEFAFLIPDGRSMIIMAVSGVATSVFLITWLLAVNRGVYLLVEVFLMLGVMVTILASAIWFEENITIGEWIGIGFLVLSAVIMCTYNNTQKKKLTLTSLALLLLCGFSNGILDFMQKMFVMTSPQASVSVYNFYTYIFSTVTLLPLLLIIAKKESAPVVGNVRKVVTSSGITIVVMAICLFVNSYFKTVAAVYLKATQLYPLNQGAALILSTLMAALFFKERFTARSFLGVLAALLSILFMNVLNL